MYRLLILMTGAILLNGCATAPRADYVDTSNPQGEVVRLQGEIEQGMLDQFDLTAPKDIARAQKHLDEAKEEWQENDSAEFWEEMAKARGYLNRARASSDRHAPEMLATLEARSLALNAGARRFERTSDRLKKIDDEVRSLANDRDPKRALVWERFRRDYRQLEVSAVQETQLGEANGLIEKAIENGARRYASRSLADAKAQVEIAAKLVEENPQRPSAYIPAVEKATRAARMLIAVNATARQAAGQSNEQIAREIVMRNQAISSLEGDLRGAELEADVTKRALVGKDVEMRGVAATNLTLLSEAEWNDAIEEVRSEFGEDEAEVYRQGDKLLIRLKKMQFPSGSAQVPSPSQPLLEKVSSVIEELNAKQVEVQGHTDSTGGPQINKKLSAKRAEAVASYLEEEVDDVQVKAVGYGYERPIVTNKTPNGRATNRRVDVIITPAKAADIED